MNISNFFNAYKLDTESKTTGETLVGVLNAEFDEFYTSYGLFSCEKSLIKFIDPKKYKAFVHTFGLDNSRFVAFAQTSFSNMFLLDKIDNAIYFFTVTTGEVSEMAFSLEFLLSYQLIQSDTMDYLLFKKQHIELTNRYGQLTQEQCFGFDPSSLKPGELSFDDVKVWNVKEYLSTLSQSIRAEIFQS
jgi:hypothetical protein